MSYSVEEEHPTHFVVRDAKGPFRIAKAGLSPATLARIQSFARGGEVRGYADGGEVRDPDDEAEADAGAIGEPGAPAFDPYAELPPPPSRPTIALTPTMQAQLRDLRAAPVVDAEAPAPAMSAADADAYAAAFRGDLAATQALPFATPPAGAVFAPPSPEPQAPAPAVEFPPAAPREFHGEVIPPEPAPEEEPAAPVAPSVSVPRLATPGAPAGFDEGVALQRAGIEAQAHADVQQATREQALQAQFAERQAAEKAAFGARLAENQQRADALRGEILESKVDPNRLYHNMSTGQRVGNVFALILGGIGAALTHGPNLAMKVLDDAIERDIEAQKLEINKKDSILKGYIQRGHDLTTAHQLAKADLADIAAAQLQRIAAQGHADDATARAQVLAGTLMQQGATLRQEAIGREFQNANAATILRQQLQLRAEQIANARAARARAGEQAKGRDALQQVEGALAAGGLRLDPRVIPRLAKDTQERLVQTSPGRYQLAYTKEAASKARDAMQAASDLQRLVGEMRVLRKEYGSETFPTAVAKRAESLHAQTMVALNRLGGLGALDKGTQDVLESLVPNVADTRLFGTTDAKVDAQLDQLQRKVETSISSALGSLLMAPRTAALPATRRAGE